MDGSIAAASSANLTAFFTNMIGTLAVILVLAAFISGSELTSRFFGSKNSWKSHVYTICLSRFTHVMPKSTLQIF